MPYTGTLFRWCALFKAAFANLRRTHPTQCHNPLLLPPDGGNFPKKHASSSTMMQFILLQAGGNPTAMLNMLMPVLLIAVMYFFMIRPQMKRQKDHQNFLQSLKEGQEVVTQGGVIGKITKIDGDIVRLLVDEKTFLRVQKSAILNQKVSG